GFPAPAISGIAPSPPSEHRARCGRLSPFRLHAGFAMSIDLSEAIPPNTRCRTALRATDRSSEALQGFLLDRRAIALVAREPCLEDAPLADVGGAEPHLHRADLCDVHAVVPHRRRERLFDLLPIAVAARDRLPFLEKLQEAIEVENRVEWCLRWISTEQVHRDRPRIVALHAEAIPLVEHQPRRLRHLGAGLENLPDAL